MVQVRPPPGSAERVRAEGLRDSRAAPPVGHQPSRLTPSLSEHDRQAQDRTGKPDVLTKNIFSFNFVKQRMVTRPRPTHKIEEPTNVVHSTSNADNNIWYSESVFGCVLILYFCIVAYPSCYCYCHKK